MRNANRIRINELAREMEVKAEAVLGVLPEIGVREKKTHSSSVDLETAGQIREILRERAGPAEGKAKKAVKKAAKPRAASPANEPQPVASRRIAEPPAAKPAKRASPIRPGRGGTPLRPPVQALRPPLRAAQPATSVPQESAPAAPAPVAAPAESGLSPKAPPVLRVEPIRRSVPTIPGIAKAPPAPRPASPPARPPMSAAGDGAALPGAPIRPPVSIARPGAARLAPPASVPRASAPGAPAAVRQPAMRVPRPAAKKAVPIPGKPIYERARRPASALPGMPPAQRFGGPRSGMPRGRGPMPGQGQRPYGRRPPRPSHRRTPRDREADREAKILRAQAKARSDAAMLKAVNTEIVVSDGMTVKDLAEKLGIKANIVIKLLVDRGLFATINQPLDMPTIGDLCEKFGATSTEISFEEESMIEVEEAEAVGDLQPRAPVVTVMGHVDHGKTSLLDAMREANVAEREAGGITQAVGAYHVDHEGRRIVFIDTPGHEAFTRMRSRGAQCTDIVVLVVAADDGVMPQTVEAMDHAKSAGVPILVAINKMDKPDANPERVKQQLADRGLLPEDWGGDTVMVPVSATTKENLDQLLEMILLVSDLKEPKANPDRPAVGTVLEAKLDRGQGPVATVLVQNGTLKTGDYFVVGAVFGRVRAMIDDSGQNVKEAPPSSAVVVLGLNALPDPGDSFQVVTDTERARKIVDFREDRAREQALAKSSRLALEQFQEQLRAGEIKELPVVLKADVQGSMEVLRDTLNKLSNEKVKVRFIHTGVGAISESDVLLATAANAVIIGFSVRPERSAAVLADREGIDIRLHTVIYELIDEIKKAMTGLLDPLIKETLTGRADVLDTFHVSKVGTVAGCLVLDGRVASGSEVRLLRDNVVIYTGRLSSLKRFKDDASEVRSGQECGMGIENFNDVKKGDVIEAFVSEKVAQEVFV